MGALLHDIGMVVSQEELDSLEDDAEFQRFREQELASRIEIESTDAAAIAHASKLAERFITAEYFRRTHPSRSAKYVFEFGHYLDPLGPHNSRLVCSVAKVCEGHALDAEELEDDTLSPSELDIQGENANLKFIAASIRLGDLLDMDSERDSLLLARFLRPLPWGAAEHWSKQQLDDFSVSPREIRIGKTCQNHEEHRVLYEWTQWLRGELAHTAAMLGQHPRLPFVPPQAKVVLESNGSYVFREYQFSLHKEAVFETLVGHRFYHDKSVFLRELLHNALDATRCRAAIEGKRGARASSFDLPKNRRRRLPITVATRLETRQGKDMRVFEVSDHGIGMTPQIITDYFLQIGKSYYRSSDFFNSYGFRPLSQYGIGFLACFMVSSYIEVETCPLAAPDEAVLLKIQGWSSHLGIEPSGRRSPGTTVRVYVHPDFVLTTTIGHGYHERRVRLADLLDSWIGHIEFPIEVMDERGQLYRYEDEWGRRSPSASALQKRYPDAIHVHRMGKHIKPPSRGIIVVTPMEAARRPNSVSHSGFLIYDGRRRNDTYFFCNNETVSAIGWHDLDVSGRDAPPLSIDKSYWTGTEETTALHGHYYRELLECLHQVVAFKRGTLSLKDRRLLTKEFLANSEFWGEKNEKLDMAMRSFPVMEGVVDGSAGYYSVEDIAAKYGEAGIAFADAIEVFEDEAYKTRLAQGHMCVCTEESSWNGCQSGSGLAALLVNVPVKLFARTSFEGCAYMDVSYEMPLESVASLWGLERLIAIEEAQRVVMVTAFRPPDDGSVPALFRGELAKLFAVRLCNNLWLLNDTHPNGAILIEVADELLARSGGERIEIHDMTDTGAQIAMRGGGIVKAASERDRKYDYREFEQILGAIIEGRGVKSMTCREPIWVWERYGQRGVVLDHLQEAIAVLRSSAEGFHCPVLRDLCDMDESAFLDWDITPLSSV
jgi:hypothetical protein